MKNNKISRMVQLAVLLGIVIFLQCFFAQIVVGTTSFSVVLVPIVVGTILLGPGAGALLGFAFGAVVLIYGIIGQDAFTNMLFVAQPAFTALICLGKGTAAGFLAGLVYRLIAKVNAFWASVAAAAIAPIANTGLFILGGLTLVRGTLEANLSTFGADSVLIFLVVFCAGINFIVEFGVNMILAPAIYRIITVVKKSFSR